MQKIIQGKKAASGTAAGPLFIRACESVTAAGHIEDTKAELERLEQARNAVRERLEQAAAGLDERSAAILNAQVMMMDDETFLESIRGRVCRETLSAAAAVLRVGEDMAQSFEAMEDPYLRARSADMRDIAGKLAEELTGARERGGKMPLIPSILVADEITPEEIATADRSIVLGIVTRKGSAASHAAIMAGNFGIPYIFGIDCPDEELREADLAALDADRGVLYLSPDEDTLKSLASAQRDEECEYHGKIRLYGNIAGPGDAGAALDAGAEGIGLYRTEFLYMNREDPPDEETQFSAYKRVLEIMGGREVIIRTMDVGADKPAPCLHLPKEQNPAMGRRAIRICLDDPDLFRTQLRALLRAACFGNEKILFPMIASAWEIDAVKEQVDLAARELSQRGERYAVPPLGIMVETPAAAVMSDVLAGKVNFFSIGTNDLTQYTIALDRNGEGLDRYYRPDHEAVMRLIEMTVRNAHAAGIPVGICGELGSNTDALERLAEIDVDELSMAPAKIKTVRRVLAAAQDKQAAADPDEEFGAPADGTLIPMEEIPDKTFSAGILGKCIGIEPENGRIYAPCDGRVIHIAETKHAISILSDRGHELIIHVGIDTVRLNGKGFKCLVKADQQVKRGELLMENDLAVIRGAGLSPITVLILTK